MALLRTARLAGGSALPDEENGRLLYTVPAGYRAVVRGMVFSGNLASLGTTETFQCWVITPEFDSFYLCFRVIPAGAYGIEWTGHGVLNAGDKVYATSASASHSIFFYQLSGALMEVGSAQAEEAETQTGELRSSSLLPIHPVIR